MSSVDGKTCRLCRAAGKKLFLKGDRCSSPKCPLGAQSAVSGQKTVSQFKSSRRRRLSDYGLQLREKQNLKRLYGIRENTLRKYFDMALKTKSATGEVMINLLESRLDNVVYRLGFAVSRQMARQIVSHCHITVDGVKVNIPSFQLKPGAVIVLDKASANNADIRKLLEDKTRALPEWLDRKALVGRFVRRPKRDEIDLDISEQSIVEFYSR